MTVVYTKGVREYEMHIGTPSGGDFVREGYPFFFYDADAEDVSPVEKTAEGLHLLYLRPLMAFSEATTVFDAAIDEYFKKNPKTNLILVDRKRKLIIYDLTENVVKSSTYWSYYLPSTFYTTFKAVTPDCIGVSKQGRAYKFFGRGVIPLVAMLSTLSARLLRPDECARTAEGTAFALRVMSRMYGYSEPTYQILNNQGAAELAINPQREYVALEPDSTIALEKIVRKYDRELSAMMAKKAQNIAAELEKRKPIAVTKPEVESEVTGEQVPFVFSDSGEAIATINQKCVIPLQEIIGDSFTTKYAYTAVQFSPEELPHVRSAYIKDKTLYLLTGMPELLDISDIARNLCIDESVIVVMTEKETAVNKPVKEEHDVVS